ncbi:MAG: site-specific DNA-methyltransferase [Bacteroidales bacterium]|nr:site-specific DNA-methyltransferase [Candidatus Liminaster caballi]
MTNYDQFRNKLQEIFMMDHAELDFGIYRIMNQKRDEITDFLDKKLLPQVQKNLGGATGNQSAADAKRMKEIEEQFGNTDIMSLPDTIPAVAEYKELKARTANSGSIEELENEVFNHLTIFFSRYYDNGDFVSKRRYKDNAYAIPYNGEEVKLHWANSDQYYIKTSEYFQNYSFNVEINKDTKVKKKVHFVLKDVTTEQNNNKAASGMERRFALYQDEDAASIEVVQNEEGQDELNIYFTYELMAKGTKQEALMTAAFDYIKENLPSEFSELITTLCPTEKNKKRTLLEKHLTDYTAKNSFDYFIHKDLGSFLRRELDFYIKNEVLLIDDLDEKHVMQQLSLVRAIKGVGEKIITMLAQIEDFQKRLWLKKKFVVQSDYCITLDRVPESFYAEICENEAQRKEWVRLFSIDEVEGYSEPLTEPFVLQNPYLVLDTAFFSLSFKHRLLSKIEEVDKNCNGLLINSENFQALELLKAKYNRSIKSIYLDPPYNTGSDNTFAYKDSFQHSSWASMMCDRARIAHEMMVDDACLFISTDDGEYANIKLSLETVFGEDNFVADIIWNSRKSVSNDALISGAINHTTFYTKDKSILTQNKTDFRVGAKEEGFINPDNDPNGPWKLDPMDAPGIRENESYGITNQATGITYYPASGRHWRFEEKDTLRLLACGRILFGKTGSSKPGYKRYKSEAMGKGDTVTTLWSDVKTTADGTKLLLDIFGTTLPKEFIDSIKPKPVEFIKKVVNVSTVGNDWVIDYFAGSATTAHAVIVQNREDDNNRKFITCEMNYYFDILTKPRIEKVIYSEDWKDGKPVSRKGISQCFKYIRLEQYEDTLNNLEVKKQGGIFANDEKFSETYMLQYMMDMDTRDSLFNIERFVHPFDVKLKTTRDNELVETSVDMVETFNYLIGLEVDTIRWTHSDEICVVEGRLHRSQDKALIIWRDTEKVDNNELNAFFRKNDYHVKDSEFDVIYVNGDNTLQNQKRDDEHWKVVLIEEEFQKRMFEGC